MAKALCEFDLIIKEDPALVVSTSNSKPLPEPITEFESYMADVKLASEIKRSVIPVPKIGNIGKQKARKRIQHQLNMSKLTRDDLDCTNCLNCKHNFVLPVGQSQMEINLQNNGGKIEYWKEITEWNSKTMSRKGGPNPKRGRSISQKLACLCILINFLNRIDGSGYLKYEWACLEYKE